MKYLLLYTLGAKTHIKLLLLFILSVRSWFNDLNREWRAYYGVTFKQKLTYQTITIMINYICSHILPYFTFRLFMNSMATFSSGNTMINTKMKVEIMYRQDQAETCPHVSHLNNLFLGLKVFLCLILHLDVPVINIKFAKKK